MERVKRTIKEIKNEIKDNASYDICGAFDKSFEKQDFHNGINTDRLIDDIESLIGDYRFKRDTLIFIVNHYLEQFYDTLMYEKTKGELK